MYFLRGWAGYPNSSHLISDSDNLWESSTRPCFAFLCCSRAKLSPTRSCLTCSSCFNFPGSDTSQKPQPPEEPRSCLACLSSSCQSADIKSLHQIYHLDMLFSLWRLAVYLYKLPSEVGRYLLFISEF